MGIASASRSARTLWMLLLGSSLLYFFSTNEADNDLWGHVLFGRDILASGSVPRADGYAYTTAGQTWVNHEWLSQVVLAAVYQCAGSAGLLVLKLAIAVVTVVLLLAVIQRRVSNVSIWGGLGLLTIAVLARGFAVRPQIFTYLLVAVTLATLDLSQRGKRRVLWLFPPLFLAWANLHGGFALGLAILGLFAAVSLLPASGPGVTPWIALAASVAATAFNPNGPRLLVYVWNELSRSHPITEWAPAVASDTAQLVFFGMLGLFVATLPFVRNWRERGWEVALAAGIGVLALRHQRHTPVFALCAAAPLAAQLDAALSWMKQRSAFVLSAAAVRLIGAALLALALMQLGLTGMRYRRDRLQIAFDPSEYPIAAVRALRHTGMRANLAVPLDWGEYVLWFLAPHVKVSLDGRFATLFPESVVEDNFTFYSGARGWRRLVDAYPTDAVLVPVGSACPIDTLPDWQLAFDSRVARIYARAGSALTTALHNAPVDDQEDRPIGYFP